MNRLYSIGLFTCILVLCLFTSFVPTNGWTKDASELTSVKDASKLTSTKDASELTSVKDASKLTSTKDASELTSVKASPDTGRVAPERLSSFENYVNSDLRQFGYDLFRDVPTTFAPVESVPVGPDYILGPGDELHLSIWGKVNAEYVPVIDRNGTINIPQMGILTLAGLTFAEGKAYMEKELSRYYLPSEVKMNVSMGKLRTIRVYVVGKAQRPGSYTVSSLSTLVSALFAAGGPSKVGSMRDIQVRRSGATITHMDIYDLLLKGDK